MHTSESAATAMAHSLRVQDVALLCAPRVLEFDMQWKRNAVPQRRGGQPVWSERPQSENAFARRLTPPTGEARAVHLTRCARPDRLLPARRRKL